MRVNVYDKVPETPLDEWMTYLKTGRVKEDTRTTGLQEVKKKLQYLSMSPKERRAYDAHLDTIMVQNDVLDTAHDEGYEEGRAEGRAEGIASVARNLMASGMDDATVSSLTGLDIRQIGDIRKTMHDV